MKYVISGRGGQGVLFLSKALAHALMFKGERDFSFLKEFDEGQRNGEIRVTFDLPHESGNRELTIKESNIVELRKIAAELGIEDEYIAKSLKTIKPSAFEKNWSVYKNES